MAAEPTRHLSPESIDTPEKLSRELDKMYEALASAINVKRDMVVKDNGAPSATVDADFEIGTSWVDETADKVYVLTSKSLTLGPSELTAVWTETS